MAHGITGIDHVLVGVHDLEGAARRWRDLGFTLTPRGSHIGWGTANYCIMFADDYVELLGIVDPDTFTNHLDERLAERGEGLLGVAFGTADAEAAFHELARSGLEPAPLQALARNLELAEGTVRPEFALVHLSAAATPGLSAFLCQPLTPALLRQPAWLSHANGARAIASVTLAVEQPAALALAYERLLGAGTAIMTDDTLTVHAGRTAILVTTADDVEVLHPGVELPETLPLPVLVAMSIQVADLRKTRDWLQHQQIAFRTDGAEVLRVAPADATGVLLEFVPVQSR